jgi:hypothetical protein
MTQASGEPAELPGLDVAVAAPRRALPRVFETVLVGAEAGREWDDVMHAVRRYVDGV